MGQKHRDEKGDGRIACEIRQRAQFVTRVGIVKSASVASSINPTGQQHRKSVSPKPGRRAGMGCRGATVSPSICMRLLAKRAKTGPARIATGIPKRKPHRSTLPWLA
jgi:hypothetical protein